jgi:hypothetical protein
VTEAFDPYVVGDHTPPTADASTRAPACDNVAFVWTASTDALRVLGKRLAAAREEEEATISPRGRATG